MAVEVVRSIDAGTQTEQVTAHQESDPTGVAALVEEVRAAQPWLFSLGRSGRRKMLNPMAELLGPNTSTGVTPRRPWLADRWVLRDEIRDVPRHPVPRRVIGVPEIQGQR